MFASRRIYRTVALLLLLLAAGDLLVVDLAFAADCENSGDECFCCCTHIVIPQLSKPEPLRELVALETPPQPEAISVIPSPVYHPPRA